MNSKTIFFISLLLTLMLMVALGRIDQPLQTAAAPQGIISFELAGDLASTKRILAEWGQTEKIWAGLSLGLDYLFLCCYPLTLALAIFFTSTRLVMNWPKIAFFGRIIAYAQFVALGLDALENFALIQLLLGSQRPLWPSLAQSCAVAKFAFVIIGLMFILGGQGFAVWARWSGRKIR
jgi:hypothetical protein